MRSSLLFAAAAALFVIPSFVLARTDADSDTTVPKCPNNAAVSTPTVTASTTPTKACPAGGGLNCNYSQTVSLAWTCAPSDGTKCVADPNAALIQKIDYRCSNNVCTPFVTVVLRGAGLKTEPCTPVTGGGASDAAGF